MAAYRKALVVTLLLALGSAAALSQAPPTAPSGPLQVTTDTPEYCNNLAGRIAAEQRTHPTPVPEVQTLAEEGQHMCEIGLIRGGLARLRRALLLLESRK